ncbi:12286_t:CDS:2 [Dentiscutata erythropus]|uniref:12286_t:CDS:1 n=1 Tax=Dentiscutata erythropus TaxID=1348616 RepID=A0A9N9B4C1_9GLOM|nr:12286_t:CDS:2 [Dentiscutata erythropus]
MIYLPGPLMTLSALQQIAFKSLKTKLFSSPILAFPNFIKKLLLLTNIFGYALGAILSQLDKGYHKRVIAYDNYTPLLAKKLFDY